MQIERIKYRDIDFNKYNACIANSQFPTIYALSWYLDAVTSKNWDVLVYHDYQYVMPIPYARLKRNFMMKSVVQPMFCQQLGIFSKENNTKINAAFLNQLKEEKLTVYHFNESLSSSFPDLVTRNNYILNLNLPYPKLFAQYKKDRKKDVKRAQNKGWEVTKITTVNIFLEALLAHASYLKASSCKTLTQLLWACDQRDAWMGRQLVDKNGQWMAMAVWLKSFDRRILISSVRHPTFAQREAGTVLRDAFIQENAETHLIFDFEGSMLPGVASFNASFGAEPRQYTVLPG